MIHTLGELIFIVSANHITTFDNVNVNTSSRWAEHSNQELPELEFIGDNLDTFSFTIKSSKFVKSNPEYISNRLNFYKTNGLPQKFILGGKVFREKEWIIESFSEKLSKINNFGRASVVDFTINLKEYKRLDKSLSSKIQDLKAKGVSTVKTYINDIDYLPFEI